MATITTSAHWNTKEAVRSDSNNPVSKWTTFIESQSEQKTFWFLVSLVVQGVFLLPVPAMLVYFFNAPVLVLPITLGLFFANIIAGMGGARTKTLLALFVASILIHLVMGIAFVI